ncbi:MAG: S1 RNA-binding domain-containing protein, partial [Clostridia bacterium]|nr:S1 RNA-binding domain-containing protein [Clostridia bacterium]
ETAKHSSEQERLAMEAEREAVDIKKVQFMQDKLGEEFNGFISGVTSFGIFVELENTVEGLITMTNLTDDYYEYEEKNYRLVGQRTRRIFRLGDPIRIKVARANTEDRKVEFVPINGAEVITPEAQRRTVQRQEAVTPRKKETGRRAKSKSRTTPKSRQETKQRDRRKRGER